MPAEHWSDHLKPRSAYESIDFGFLLVRSHYFRLLALAAAFVLPLAAVPALLAPAYLAWAPLALWWLKPLWSDRSSGT